MAACKRCSVAMGEMSATLSADAIQVLVQREKSLERVAGKAEWRDGPLCDRCLAAWSALIHSIEQKTARE